MANSTVCQSKWNPIAEPRRAKPKTYHQTLTHWFKVLRRRRHWVWGPIRRRAIKEWSIAINNDWVQAAAHPRHEEEGKTDKTKQAQIEQTYKKY